MSGDVEETRLSRVPARIRDRYDEVVRSGDAALLWRHAVADVQGGYFDDRPLYWARLKLRRLLRSRGEPTADAEGRSRGFANLFARDEPSVLLTGFDPFHLDRNIAQSNPSGLAALALDNTVVAGTRVRTAILPVRFADFDRGVVEELLTSRFRHGLAMCLTVSMGRYEFDLERFPGRRRSAEVADNQNVLTGASPSRPIAPPGLDGPEFLQFSLPAEAMAAVSGRWRVRDNRHVVSLQRGRLAPRSLADLAQDTAVSGASGGYLSNEVAYRSLLLRERMGVSFPAGHLHTPAVAGWDEAMERDMITQIRRLLEAALGHPH